MNFPSLQSAEDYLRGTIQDFYDQRGVLAGRLRAIVKLKEAAIKKNDQQALGQLILMRESVMALLREQVTMEERLEPYKDYFGNVVVGRPATLGLLPLVLAVGGVAVATALYLYYEKLKNQGKALDLIAKGLLPAEQADAILNPSFLSGLGGSFSMVGIAIAGGLALVLFITNRR